MDKRNKKRENDSTKGEPFPSQQQQEAVSESFFSSNQVSISLIFNIYFYKLQSSTYICSKYFYKYNLQHIFVQNISTNIIFKYICSKYFYEYNLQHIFVQNISTNIIFKIYLSKIVLQI